MNKQPFFLRFLSKVPQKALLLFFLMALVYSCARMSSPTGGPKDVDPPMPIKSKPLNYSTNFKDDRVLVQFDEFIVLKNVNDELLISPPVPEKPEVKLRGKNLIVDINNELKDSTTYNLNFYNAITDLNEGNLLPNFQFEFSTGPEFDSIYLGGIVKNAFDYKTQANLKVMLYNQWHDSLPRTTTPNYVAKTDKKGHFFVTNLKDEPYYIFALNDMNNNMKFDLPNEGIAFSEETYQPDFKETIYYDTLHLIRSISDDLEDTVYFDSIRQHVQTVTTIDDINLFMFTEDFEPQYFERAAREKQKQVLFVFNRGPVENLKIVPINPKPLTKNWSIRENVERQDSIVLWLTDTTLYKKDSIHFQVNYTLLDSNEAPYLQTDTLLLTWKPEPEKKEETKEKKGGRFNLGFLNNEEEEVEKDTIVPSELTFETNAKSPFEMNKPLELTTKYPIKNIDTSKIELFIIEDDTVEVPLKYSFYQKKFGLRTYYMDFEKEEEESYKAFIPAGTFEDVYGNINDTLEYRFSTRSLDFYGKIILHLIHVKESSIVQLLTESEQVIEERPIFGDTTLVFDFMHPKKYMFKLFYDPNNNGEWDTGKLSEMRQAETVFYFPQEVEAKGNWEMEYDWDLYPVPPELIMQNDSLQQDTLNPVPPSDTLDYNLRQPTDSVAPDLEKFDKKE